MSADEIVTYTFPKEKKKRKRVDKTFKQIKRKGKAEEIWKNYCKNLKLKQIL